MGKTKDRSGLDADERNSNWEQRRERILSRYFSLLADADSPLLRAGPDVEAQVASQLLAIADAAAGVGTGKAANALSSDIGRSRAASGIHPSVSLAAARMIFVAALPEVAGHMNDMGHEESAELAAIRLNDAILQRMADAAANYVSFLLEKTDQAHRDEAKRLSRDLHDVVGPGIAGAIQCMDLAQRYRTSEPDRAKTKVDLARATLVEAHAALRTLAAETRISFDPGCLGQALIDYMANLAEDLHGTLESDGPLEDVPAHYEREVFLIVREAIQNARTHSSATAVVVRLSAEGVHLHAEVRDNGCGISSARQRHGTGVSSMHERAALLGGHLAIEGSSSGTSVKLTVPLPNRTRG